MPEPSREAKTLPVADGFTKVPADLLFSEVSDLGVLIWALLRLRFEDKPSEVSYSEIAAWLGLGDSTESAVEKRLTATIRPLLRNGWLKRTRSPRSNRRCYQALVPKGSGTRYGVLRRCDLALLKLTEPRYRKKPAHLVDFLRWQLECGTRGWTIEPTELIAARWGVSTRTLRRRRDDIRTTREEAGFLTIEERPGLPDLVWLSELVDIHWRIPSTFDDVAPADEQAMGEEQAVVVPLPDRGLPASPADPSTASWRVAKKVGETVPDERVRVVKKVGSLGQKGGVEGGQKGGVLYKEDLTELPLTEDLADLGGASATPVTSATRASSNAVPQAAPSRETSSTGGRTSSRNAAGRLISEHRYLVGAPAHFRAAMMRRLTRAIDGGLDERHLGRALARVVDQADGDAHCELVRLAVQQAWSDQRGGTCPECAGDGSGSTGHAFSCAARRTTTFNDVQDDPAAIQAAIVGSLAEARRAKGETARAGAAGQDIAGPEAAPGPAQSVDVLAPLLEVSGSPVDWETGSSEELVDGLEVALARLTAPAPQQVRLQALERAWARLRPQVPPDRRDLLDVASLRLRRRLEQALVGVRAS